MLFSPPCSHCVCFSIVIHPSDDCWRCPLRFLAAFISFAFLTCLCLGVAGLVFGQGTDLGTIRGTVTDSTGAAIPNATVTVTDALTNTARQTKTNSQGQYEMFGLNLGTYRVVISAPGMAKEEITGIVLSGSDTVSADAVLKVSAAQESVVVSMEAPAINTEDQTISQTIDNLAVIELPRDSRNVYTFLYLDPNVTQSAADGSFKFIGAQSYGASFSLDGQRSNGGIFGEPTSSQPSLEAVGEINLLTSDFSAEYAGIANVRVSTKRGGSDYHGSAFYNNKNSALAAWTLDDKNNLANFSPNSFQSKYPNPYFNLNDIGGSIGGPIPLLKKTWFFAAYERDYAVAPTQIASATIPHPLLYTGDFSALNDSAKPAVPSSVTLTPQEIAGNTIDDGTGTGGRKFVTIPSIQSPLLSPDSNAGGGGGTFAWLGSFNVRVDQTTGKLLPIDPVNDVTRNDQFGRLLSSFTQEGIDNRRSVRLRLRITF